MNYNIEFYNTCVLHFTPIIRVNIFLHHTYFINLWNIFIKLPVVDVKFINIKSYNNILINFLNNASYNLYLKYILIDFKLLKLKSYTSNFFIVQNKINLNILLNIYSSNIFNKNYYDCINIYIKLLNYNFYVRKYNYNELLNNNINN